MFKKGKKIGLRNKHITNQRMHGEAQRHRSDTAPLQPFMTLSGIYHQSQYGGSKHLRKACTIGIQKI